MSPFQMIASWPFAVAVSKSLPPASRTATGSVALSDPGYEMFCVAVRLAGGYTSVVLARIAGAGGEARRRQYVLALQYAIHHAGQDQSTDHHARQEIQAAGQIPGELFKPADDERADVTAQVAHRVDQGDARRGAGSGEEAARQ